MATKKTSTEKKQKLEKKEKADFTDFIKYGIAPVIIRNVSKIKEICEKYKGIGEMDIDSWKFLNQVLVDCWKDSGKYADEAGYMVKQTEVLKRATPYTLAHKVREMQTKSFILDHIAELELAPDDDMRIYRAYLVYSQINVHVSENSQQKKEARKKNDPD